MSIIDFGELTNIIKDIDKLLYPYNIEERKLIINNILIRLNKEAQMNNESEVMQRAISNLPFGKLMSKAMKTEVNEND